MLTTTSTQQIVQLLLVGFELQLHDLLGGGRGQHRCACTCTRWFFARGRAFGRVSLLAWVSWRALFWKAGSWPLLCRNAPVFEGLSSWKLLCPRLILPGLLLRLPVLSSFPVLQTLRLRADLAERRLDRRHAPRRKERIPPSQFQDARLRQSLRLLKAPHGLRGRFAEVFVVCDRSIRVISKRDQVFVQLRDVLAVARSPSSTCGRPARTRTSRRSGAGSP